MMKTKQKRWRWQIILTTVMLILAAASFSGAARIESFTADNVVLNADGSVKFRGKLYVTPDKIRSEQPMGSDKKMVIIYRRDKNQLWALDPEKKTYIQMPLDEKKWKEEAKGLIKDEQAKILGRETVSGYSCVKKQITSQMELMGMQISSSQTVWVSNMLDMPVRTRSEDGTTTELQNIKKGTPPAGVFEIPSGYEKKGDNFMALFMDMGEVQRPPAEQRENTSDEMQLPFNLKGITLPFGNQ